MRTPRLKALWGRLRCLRLQIGAAVLLKASANCQPSGRNISHVYKKH
jgi:hypothetical protein